MRKYFLNPLSHAWGIHRFEPEPTHGSTFWKQSSGYGRAVQVFTRISAVNGRIDLNPEQLSGSMHVAGHLNANPQIMAKALHQQCKDESAYLSPLPMHTTTSMRETTPEVTLIVSPPIGYPTTATGSCTNSLSQKLEDFLPKETILQAFSTCRSSTKEHPEGPQ